ncbi:MAG: gamma-glutamylcyclotransferase [Actinobacteria bacterium]|nr:gamma-glutamylcyclotransferase [Actinomycetota bacterium]
MTSDTPARIERQLLPPPEDTTLPLFVYGNLKCGELGHGRIDRLVDHLFPTSVEGVLWERDGMPLLTLRDEGLIAGELIWFKSDDGYRNVINFEPATHYRWARVACTGQAGQLANVLVAGASLEPARDGGDRLHEPWTTTRDPLFRYGLPAVATAVRADGLVPFRTLGNDPNEWQRFFRLQSAYMLTCSILERLTLRVVPGKLDKVAASITALGRQKDFKNAVEQVGLQNWHRGVGRADRPTEAAPLENRSDFATWAYQVRSNIAHQGKSAWQEAELVRTTLIDLHDVLRIYLLEKMPGFEQSWSEADPTAMDYHWRIKQSPEYLAVA